MNPHASRRHPLKMVCLPISPLPRLKPALFQLLTEHPAARRAKRYGLRSPEGGRNAWSFLMLSCPAVYCNVSGSICSGLSSRDVSSVCLCSPRGHSSLSNLEQSMIRLASSSVRARQVSPEKVPPWSSQVDRPALAVSESRVAILEALEAHSQSATYGVDVMRWMNEPGWDAKPLSNEIE